MGKCRLCGELKFFGGCWRRGDVGDGGMYVIF